MSSGAKLLTGGAVGDDGVLRPTLLDEVSLDMAVACHEVFGPVVTVARFASLDEAIEKANGTEYGLQAGVFTQDISKAMRAARELEFGGVTLNEAPTYRADQMPYGGVKESATRARAEVRRPGDDRAAHGRDLAVDRVVRSEQRSTCWASSTEATLVSSAARS